MRLRKILLVLVIIILIVCVWGYFANPGRNILRLQTTGLNSHFTTTPTESFENYVSATRKMLKLAREHAHTDASDQVIANNAPAVLMPDANNCKASNNGKYDNGILLIHGLLDSGYAMQQLGKFFQSKCFIVYVVLLPGHGTTPGDLLKTTSQDWINATDYGATKLSQSVNHVYLGGFSLGGLLAIHEALLRPDTFKGLILFAPVLKIKSHLTPLIPLVYWSSKIIQRLQWWSVYDDSATTRYESLAINPVYQTAKLIEKVRKQLTKQVLTLPIMIEQSQEDVTVDAKATLTFFSTNTNSKSRLLWFYQKGNYSLLPDPRIQTIVSSLPEQRILSLSHLSLTLAEDDPIYGINGQYRDCLHYPEHSKIWLQCKSGAENYYGEITDKNLNNHLLQRITFNPFIEFVTQRIGNFIDSIN